MVEVNIRVAAHERGKGRRNYMDFCQKQPAERPSVKCGKGLEKVGSISSRHLKTWKKNKEKKLGRSEKHSFFCSCVCSLTEQISKSNFYHHHFIVTSVTSVPLASFSCHQQMVVMINDGVLLMDSKINFHSCWYFCYEVTGTTGTSFHFQIL